MFLSQQRKIEQKPKTKDAGRKTRQGARDTPWNRLALGISSLSTTDKPLQAKLTIGAPDDRYEQEADRVADRVMRMAEPSASGAYLCQGDCPLELQKQPLEEEEEEVIQPQPLEEEEEMLQPKGEGTGSGKISASVSLQGLRGKGTPIPTHSRSYFEPRFGCDFSSVRLHTGPKAEEAAASVRAKAFTSGNDIVFNKGKYTPESFEGNKLLAHELTHVVQQAS